MPRKKSDKESNIRLFLRLGNGSVSSPYLELFLMYTLSALVTSLNK